MRNVSKMRKLDQYYTDEKVADYCMSVLNGKLGTHINTNDVFLEPSAGCGVFIDSVNKVFIDNKIISFDIDPMRKDITKSDFLKEDIEKYRNLITIGNPPFGKKAKLALDFYNKAMKHSKVVAFIVPMQFNKWGMQKRINKDFKLIHNETLNPYSFIFDGQKYPVRSVFQIWTTELTNHEDQRIKKAPPTSHIDFKSWQYNNTPSTLKYFDYDWDFAVLRQGYGNYNEIIYNKDDLNESSQYIFLKANDSKIYKRLLRLDYEGLSMLNTSTPGFGKADLVSHYSELYDKAKK